MSERSLKTASTNPSPYISNSLLIEEIRGKWASRAMNHRRHSQTQSLEARDLSLECFKFSNLRRHMK